MRQLNAPPGRRSRRDSVKTSGQVSRGCASHVSVLDAKSIEPAGEPGVARIARREVADPGNAARGTRRATQRGARRFRRVCAAGFLLELRAQGTLERRDRVVDELETRARADVDEYLLADAERGICDRDCEIPAGAELVERRVVEWDAGAELLVRASRCA